MNEGQRGVLVDIFSNTDALHKISITLDIHSRDVTIVYGHMDYEWFQELLAETATSIIQARDFSVTLRGGKE